MGFRTNIRLSVLKKKFRRMNTHNAMKLLSLCNPSKIVVGKRSYGEINVIDSSSSNNKLYIGSYCSVAQNVRFLLGGEHCTNTISTYPFKVRSFGWQQEAGCKGDIVIHDDVWLCEGVIICSGVTIGQGAVVAAGAVVTKSVEPYAVVGGNPARFIKWRFDEKLRMELCNINIEKLFDSFTCSDISDIYSPLDERLLLRLSKRLGEMQK